MLNEVERLIDFVHTYIHTYLYVHAIYNPYSILKKKKKKNSTRPKVRKYPETSVRSTTCQRQKPVNCRRQTGRQTRGSVQLCQLTHTGPQINKVRLPSPEHTFNGHTPIGLAIVHLLSTQTGRGGEINRETDANARSHETMASTLKQKLHKNKSKYESK